MDAPPASTPKTARVPFHTGASNKVGVLNVYKTVELNSTGRHIVELASFYPKAHEVYVTSGMDGAGTAGAVLRGDTHRCQR